MTLRAPIRRRCTASMAWATVEAIAADALDGDADLARMLPAAVEHGLSVETLERAMSDMFGGAE